MASVSENIAVIVAQAEILDGLIADFRAAKAAIDAAELAIRKAQPAEGHDVILGRARLAYYAHALMIEPSIEGRKTVAELATSGWAGVSASQHQHRPSRRSKRISRWFASKSR